MSKIVLTFNPANLPTDAGVMATPTGARPLNATEVAIRAMLAAHAERKGPSGGWASRGTICAALGVETDAVKLASLSPLDKEAQESANAAITNALTHLTSDATLPEDGGPVCRAEHRIGKGTYADGYGPKRRGAKGALYHANPKAPVVKGVEVPGRASK